MTNRLARNVVVPFLRRFSGYQGWSAGVINDRQTCVALVQASLYGSLHLEHNLYVSVASYFVLL